MLMLAASFSTTRISCSPLIRVTLVLSKNPITHTVLPLLKNSSTATFFSRSIDDCVCGLDGHDAMVATAAKAAGEDSGSGSATPIDPRPCPETDGAATEDVQAADEDKAALGSKFPKQPGCPDGFTGCQSQCKDGCKKCACPDAEKCAEECTKVCKVSCRYAYYCQPTVSLSLCQPLSMPTVSLSLCKPLSML